MISTFLLASTVYANPVTAYSTPFGDAHGNPATFLFVAFVVTVFFEFAIISLILSKAKKGRLFLAVLFVNFVSFPISVIFSELILAYPEYEDITPLVPIVIESLLYIRLFRLFYKRAWIPKPVSIGKCFLLGGFSNIVTFLMGVLFLAFLGPKPMNRPSRVTVDMRTLSTGIEAYVIDHGVYPPDGFALTTPTPYLTSLFIDPYTSGKNPTILQYLSWGTPEEKDSGYVIWSMGPDKKYDLNEDFIRDILKNYNPDMENPLELFIPYYYDPTNGLKSRGDITRFGGSWLD